MKSLKGTQTEKNLMKAFMGECQARMRYTYILCINGKKRRLCADFKHIY